MERCTIKSINTLPDYFYNKSNVLRTGYTFTEEVLNNITPLALAIYYIDDGSKLPCKKDGSKTAVNVQYLQHTDIIKEKYIILVIIWIRNMALLIVWQDTKFVWMMQDIRLK